MIFSCKRYKLSETDLEWQPYKKGDRLIFESNKGEIDTIIIESVESYFNADDHLSLLPSTVQTLFVMGNIELLKLSSDKYGSKVEFKLRLGKNDLKYPGIILYLNEENLEASEEVEFNTKRCYKIKAIESRGNMKNRSFDLNYIYWSMRYGYLGLEFKDNYVWNLKSFTRNGKEIY